MNEPFRTEPWKENGLAAAALCSPVKTKPAAVKLGGEQRREANSRHTSGIIIFAAFSYLPVGLVDLTCLVFTGCIPEPRIATASSKPVQNNCAVDDAGSQSPDRTDCISSRALAKPLP